MEKELFVGDMNLVKAIVDLEVQAEWLTTLLNKLSKRSVSPLTQPEIDAALVEAQKVIIGKYPKLNIDFNT